MDLNQVYDRNGFDKPVPQFPHGLLIVGIQSNVLENWKLRAVNLYFPPWLVFSRYQKPSWTVIPTVISEKEGHREKKKKIETLGIHSHNVSSSKHLVIIQFIKPGNTVIFSTQRKWRGKSVTLHEKATSLSYGLNHDMAPHKVMD